MGKNQKLVGRSGMETVTHGRAMLAFCRQRALMDGEDERFRLTAAEMWQKRSRSGGNAGNDAIKH